ncbi:MAG: hypothetical protein IJ695_09545 [Butyrivibrio sp.]|nr:hypothetical protein [Butyrivibrio sp.]
MEANLRSFFYKLKKFQTPLEKSVFPIVLLLYPLLGAGEGLDITDTSYSLANYEFLDKIDPMWALSTFLSNLTGGAIMHLPGAGSMLGMNIYCSFVISGIALICYYLLSKWEPHWMIFLGEFIAISLCWCPRVILYNYLTYLFFNMGLLLLLIGMFDWRRQNIFLFLAGVCLGLNVMVRFPNITEAALILVLWFYEAITGDEFVKALKKTLICIGGYAAGVLVPLLFIMAKYGATSYFEMIGSLFGMTGGASDYTAGGMLSSIISAYLTACADMLIMIPCVAAGIIMFRLFKGRFVLTKKLLYVLGILILVRYFFSTGTFTRNYYYYDSVFGAAMMFVIFSLILGVIGSLGILNGSRQERALSFSMVLVILITPLGSNNYTYPVINNLFFVAPVSLWMFRRLMFRLGDGDLHFAWQGMVTMVIAYLLVQGTIFRALFAFGDGMDSQVRDSFSTVPKVSAMRTTRQKAEDLDELAEALNSSGLRSRKAIFFGAVPGLSYIFDMEPAIDTVWPDLDSYGTDKFVTQLEVVSEAKGALPVIIKGRGAVEYASYSSKEEELLDFMYENGYNLIFENDSYELYAD